MTTSKVTNATQMIHSGDNEQDSRSRRLPKWSKFEICRFSSHHGALRAIIAGAAIGRAATAAIHRSAADAAEIRPREELPKFPAGKGGDCHAQCDCHAQYAQTTAAMSQRSNHAGAKSLDSVDHSQAHANTLPVTSVIWSKLHSFALKDCMVGDFVQGSMFGRK